MSKHHPSKKLWLRRFRCGAIAGLTAVSLIASASFDLRAEWPLSKRKKPVETPESKQAKDFNNAIRKLVSEAKSHADKGELDRAIYLADRAAKISESSANLVQCAPDVSPSTMAKFVSDLRSQRADRMKLQGTSIAPESIVKNASDTPTTPATSPAQNKPPKSKTSAESHLVQAKSSVGSGSAVQVTQHRSETAKSKLAPEPTVESQLAVNAEAPPLSTDPSRLNVTASDELIARQDLEPSTELAGTKPRDTATGSPTDPSSADALHLFDVAKTVPNASKSAAAIIAAQAASPTPPEETAAPQLEVTSSEPFEAPDESDLSSSQPIASEHTAGQVTQDREPDSSRSARVASSLEMDEGELITDSTDPGIPGEKPLIHPAVLVSNPDDDVVSASAPRSAPPLAEKRDDRDLPHGRTEPVFDSADDTGLSLAKDDARHQSLGNAEAPRKTMDSDLAVEQPSNLKLRSRFPQQAARSFDDAEDVTPSPPAIHRQSNLAGPTADKFNSNTKLERQTTSRLTPPPPPEIAPEELDPKSAVPAFKLRNRYQDTTSQRSTSKRESGDLSQHRPANQDSQRVEKPLYESADELKRRPESSSSDNTELCTAIDVVKKKVDVVTTITESEEDSQESSTLRIRTTIKLRKSYNAAALIVPVSVEEELTQPQDQSGETQAVLANNSSSNPTITATEPATSRDETGKPIASHQAPFRLRKQRPAARYDATGLATAKPPREPDKDDARSRVAPLPPNITKSSTPSRMHVASAKGSSAGLQSQRDSISLSNDPSAPARVEKRALVSTNPSSNAGARRKPLVFDDDQAVLSRSVLANGPIQRFADFFNLSHNTASSSLAVIGVAMLIGGLWLIRATLLINPA